MTEPGHLNDDEGIASPLVRHPDCRHFRLTLSRYFTNQRLAKKVNLTPFLQTKRAPEGARFYIPWRR
jgi:hypothetical protein